MKDEPSVTADGKKFTIAANIGTPNDMPGVHENGAEAIGLYRTEFLYMDSQTFQPKKINLKPTRKLLKV